ncbi:MAG: SusC/RagA family TonB-linked outer membrane protein [Gemmatimonas sp.]
MHLPWLARAALIVLLAHVVPFAPTYAQDARATRPLSGRVTEEGSGAPATQVQIVLGGVALGSTRDDGTYSVRIPNGAVTVTFRRIGFVRSDQAVAANVSTLDVVLRRDLLRLSEMVVTGQATGIERRNAATAIASVSAAELNRVPAPSVETMLAGRVPGAEISSNSGAPGGGNQVRLRGISTVIGAATPLYVVDGVIISDATIAPGVFAVTGSSANPVVGGRQDNASNRVADLDPNSIERIEVLKGATAASIYGSRANNGVVLITTKRGNLGKPAYTFTQRFGRPEVARTIGLRRFNSQADAIATFGPAVGALWKEGAFFDHEREVYGETPTSWESIMSVSGGSNDTRYFASGLLKDDGGIIANTGYRKQSLTVGLDQNISSKLTARVTTNLLGTKTGRGLTNNDNRGVALGQALARSPSFIDLRRNPDGSFPRNPAAQSNPLQTAALSKNDEVVYRAITSGNLTYNAFTRTRQDLRFIASGGVDFFNQRSNILTPPDLQFEPLDGLPGTAVRSNAQSLNMNLNVSAVHTYRSAGGGLQATTSIGHQYEQRGLSNSRVVAQNLIGGLDNIGRATAVSVAEDDSRTNDIGINAQEELLLLDQKLFLAAGFRADRSSNNSDPNQYYFFPRAQASYRFVSLPSIFDELKVRLATGRSGNQPQFGQKFTEFFGGNIAGLPTIEIGSGAQTADANLRPEIQREIETGLDLSMLKGRAALEFSYFDKQTDDLLVTATLPNSTGYGLRIFNGGSIQTRGYEAALKGFPIVTKSFEWNSTTTFSTINARVRSLPVPPFQAPGFGTTFGVFQIEAGKSLTQIVGNDSLPTGQGIVTQVGDANPDFRMGFSNSFRMGPFNLTSLFDWQQGGEVINLTRYLWDASRNGADCNDLAPLPNATNETICARRLRTFPRQTRNYIEDASFVKLRELTLTYDLPSALVRRAMSRAESARLTLSGRNLLIITDYTGLDPEVSNFGTQAVSRGFDVSPYPPSRSFWFSIDVRF